MHECVRGIGPGKVKPEMNPKYLCNTPWWDEPEKVKDERIDLEIEEIGRQLDRECRTLRN
jgi:hypothetical protein